MLAHVHEEMMVGFYVPLTHTAVPKGARQKVTHITLEQSDYKNALDVGVHQKVLQGAV